MTVRLIYVSTISFACLALDACTIVPGPKSAAYGSAVSGAKIMFAMSAVPQAQSDRLARAATRQILVGQGFEVSVTAPITVEVGFAFREPSISFVAEAHGAGTSLADELGRSSARRARLLDVCAEKIARLTIVLFDARTQTRIYRGVAEESRCADPNQDNMTIMAAAALRNLRRN